MLDDVHPESSKLEGFLFILDASRTTATGPFHLSETWLVFQLNPAGGVGREVVSIINIVILIMLVSVHSGIQVREDFHQASLYSA